MTDAAELRRLLRDLPARMKTTRRKLPSKTRMPCMGIRTAAAQIGISPTTYGRAEKNASGLDMVTVILILDWIKKND